jgi:hypothetical protein
VVDQGSNPARAWLALASVSLARVNPTSETQVERRSNQPVVTHHFRYKHAGRDKIRHMSCCHLGLFWGM